MDIAHDPKMLTRREWIARGRWALVAGALIAALLSFRHWLAPSVTREEIRTAIVERGAVSTEVRATGTVVPISERVHISPVTSTIARVLRPLGSRVGKGDAILELDRTHIEQHVARLVDELRLKDLEIEGLRQQQKRALQDLRSREAVARLELENQKLNFERYDKLVQSSIVSRFDHDTARLNATRTRLQLEQLAQQVTDTLQSDDNALSQRGVERRLLAQQLAEQQALLRDTTIRASTDGIITVLQGEIGRNVAGGTELARISDLSSYRIDATLSDFYLHQIANGMPVAIRLGDGHVDGRVEQVMPAVENGTIRLRITLDDPANPKLKPNQRIEAGIVTESRDSGLRVANGVAFNGAGLQDVFVVKDGEATKRQVEVGLTNAGHVEIITGLAEGDEIIISDTSAWQHLGRVRID